ncbi:MAG TPA: hydantoinase B/oxoprolinase family protein, partial [Acetobacteraceae bacterium]|nr:hydantoinase B/oxoprolinase family protein [Acetobacteraceae bacterium]
FIYVDFTAAAWGGRPYADGLDGNSNIYANMASQSIEVTEAEQPIQITAYEFIQDAMGPGKYRGGAPFRRDYRLTTEEAILQVRSDRRTFRPYGLYGGGPGRNSMNYLNPQSENVLLASKITMMMKHGDVFRHEVAGAGGWGDPLERDPDAVLRDVRNEFVSLEAARREYGVVIAAGNVDTAATKTLRAEMRAARGWTEPPFVRWVAQ